MGIYGVYRSILLPVTADDDGYKRPCPDSLLTVTGNRTDPRNICQNHGEKA